MPSGYRAISLQTTEEIAVAGLIHPGDRVDVQLVLRGEPLGPEQALPAHGEARTLLENVRVLAVGAAIDGARGPSSSAAAETRTVTLALQPRDVSIFTLARSLGSLFLTLRNPDEASDSSKDAVRLGDIRGGVVAGPLVRSHARRAASPARSVELVVGDERSVLTVGGRI